MKIHSIAEPRHTTESRANAGRKVPSRALAAFSILAMASGCHAPVGAAQKPARAAQQATPQVNDVTLSHYDKDIASPQIAAGPDGTLHVAFVEATQPGVEDFVFYRSSRDGGKTWTQPTNLSEDMPGRTVGPVRLALDGQGRVYAVWRASAVPYVALDADSHQSAIACNLFYRVLSGGQWSPILPVNDPQADPQHQWSGPGSFFVGRIARPEGLPARPSATSRSSTTCGSICG